jgi:uncharacterized membrane protein
MGKKRESHTRSIVKTITWRFIATMTTVVIVFFFTGKLALSLGVGAVEVISKIIFYYLHERIWGKLSWGKPKHPLDDLPVKRELSPEHKEEIRKKLQDLGYL